MIRTAVMVAAVLVLASAAESEPVEKLTRNTDRSFRVRQGKQAGPWKPTPTAAVKSADVSSVAARWPKKWRTFVAWEPNQTTRSSTAAARQDEVPVTLTLGGISASRATLPLYTNGVLDLTVGQGAPARDRWAWVFGAIKAPRDEKLLLAIEAAGPVTVWIDGKRVLRARRPGEHTAPVNLASGGHVLAAKVHSGANRWFLKGRLHPADGPVLLEQRCVFDVDDPDRFASLTVRAPGRGSVTLNGKAVSHPLEGMLGDRLVGADTVLLKRGRNVLSRTVPLKRAKKRIADDRDIELEALGVREQDARITMGPVVAPAKAGALRIAVASDANVPAVLRIDGREIVSPTGVYHRWVVGGLKPATRYEYSVRVGKGQTRKATLRTLPEPDKPLTVAIVGDPQSGRAWKSVAAALTEKRPDLVVIAGDLVVDGLVEQQWHETFLDPAEDLLAAVPFLVVPGNHDRYSPLMETLFGYGKPRPHWTRRAGGALLVGIDGGADFSPDGPGRRWLAGKLCRADAPLAFVVSHYPAYSSRNHGKLADDGRVLEWTSRSARNHLVPLLNKHGVAALFGGHDHGYERSELPGGLTALVTGGGGAGTYPKRTDAQKQNPYSKAFAAKHHYSLLRIDDGNATLRVLTPEGRQIDTRRWTAKPRKEKQL